MIRRKPTLEARIAKLERLMNEALANFDELADGVENWMYRNFKARLWPNNGTYIATLERLADGQDDEIIDELVADLSAEHGVDERVVQRMRPALLNIVAEIANDILTSAAEKWKQRRPRRRF